MYNKLLRDNGFITPSERTLATMLLMIITILCILLVVGFIGLIMSFPVIGIAVSALFILPYVIQRIFPDRTGGDEQ
jgi:hypothetical protein